MDSLPNEPERKPRVVRFHGVDYVMPDVPDSPAERKRLVDELWLQLGRILLDAARDNPPPWSGPTDRKPEPEAPPPPAPPRPLTEDEVRALPRYRPFGRKGKAGDGR